MHLTSKHYITTFIRAEHEHRQLLTNLISKIKSHFLLVHCLDPICSQQQNERNVATTTTTTLATTTECTMDDECVASDEALAASSIKQPNNHRQVDMNIFNCIEQVFLNGLRTHKSDNTPDIWPFIEALHWLNPQMTTSIANQLQQTTINHHNQHQHHHIPLQRIRNNRALTWIYECLETRTLSKKLQFLLSDHEHLANCYEITAYVHSKRYMNALFCCLHAIECEKPNLLSEISSTLYEIRSDIGSVGDECASMTNSATTNRNTSGDPINDDRRRYNSDTERERSMQPLKSASCSADVDHNSTSSDHIGNMGNTRSLPINYDLSPSSSLYDISDVMAVDQQQIQLQERPSFGGGRLSKPTTKSLKVTSPSSSVAERRHRRRFGGRMRIKCKHMISQRLRPWISLPDVRGSATGRNKTTINRCRSQPIFRSNQARVNKLTAENLALNDRCLTQMKAMPTPRTAPRFDRLDLASNDCIDLTPINLVKCDNIKIHLDRQLAPNQREDGALTPRTAQPTDANTPGTSPNVGKSNGKFSDFWRNIPGKRNIFFSALRPDESGSDEKQTNSAPGDFVNTFLPQVGEKIEKRYSHTALQDVVRDTETPLLISQMPVTPNTAAKMLPTRGQSLTSYLQELQSHRVNVTDLERENAHFDLSDAIISAIEQAKCLHRDRLKDKQIRQAVRRSKKRFTGRPRRLRNWFNEASDYNGTMNDQSRSEVSPASSTSVSSDIISDSDISHASNNSAASVNDDGDTDAGDLSYLQIFSVSSHSLNDHTAYAEWAESSLESYSAEGIALSLISKFKDKQLPSASDILSDASMMDDGYTLNDPYGMRQLTCTRGTAHWAPPRPQIIFTRHPTPDRKRLLHQQNNKCAGCGMQVTAYLSHYFRYCEYLGKYHCTGCHRNQISAIPARILERFDFSCHPVSVFAYRLLEQIWKVPLFHVPDLNKELYGKVRALRLARQRRLQLKYITDYIRQCRFADDARQVVDKCPPYYVDDVDVWSVNDFIAVRNGAFVKDIQRYITVGEQHVYNCELCTNRAFLCEYCDMKQVIFPWQNKVIRCNDCGACAHNSCWKANTICSKCQRMQQRKQSNPTQIYTIR